jgi:ubiquitin C-terminal hydrolase
MLKEKIFAQLPPDLDYKFFQLFINSKFMDTIYDDETLASLSVTSASSITTDIHRKLKAKHSNQLIKSSGHCGLRNLGNTCYMNSALQCLSQVVPLTDYFLQHKDIEGDVAQAYSDFIRNVWSDRKIFEPRQIKMSVSNYAPQFTGFNQEDAHEFMTFLLNQLHIDLKQQQTTSIISELFHGRVNGITTCLTCGYIKSTSNLITFIPVSLDKNRKKRQFVISFEPIYPNILTVETGASGCVKHLIRAFIKELQLRHKLSTEGFFERIQILSTHTGQELPFETPLNDIFDTDLKIILHKEVLRESHSSNCTNQSSFELSNCIRDFVALEIPETLWFCKSECQRATHAAKRMNLSILPPVLIVQLRRFINENGHRRKLHTFVNFPMNDLNLSEFVVDQQTTPLYDLIAVVNHIGTTIDRGHYTTYARQLTNSTAWYSFNDEHVSRIEENDVVSQDAYLLVYVKHEK